MKTCTIHGCEYSLNGFCSICEDPEDLFDPLENLREEYLRRCQWDDPETSELEDEEP